MKTLKQTAKDAEFDEIVAHARKCTHYSPYFGGCANRLNSGGWHWSLTCDLDCPRIKRYAKKNEIEITEEMRKEFFKINNI